MFSLIGNAWAAGAGGASGQTGGWQMIIFIVIIFAIFWLFLIRPQQKKQKEHQKMIQALNSGDEVVTTGGIMGKITNVSDQYLTLEIAKGVEVKVQRHSVGSILPKGTIKHG